MLDTAEHKHTLCIAGTHKTVNISALEHQCMWQSFAENKKVLLKAGKIFGYFINSHMLYFLLWSNILVSASFLMIV